MEARNNETFIIRFLKMQTFLPTVHNIAIRYSFFHTKITKTSSSTAIRYINPPVLLCVCTFLARTFSASLMHGAANTCLNTLKSAYVRTSSFCEDAVWGADHKRWCRLHFADGACVYLINLRNCVIFIVSCVSALSFSCYNSCSFSINKLRLDDYPEIGAWMLIHRLALQISTRITVNRSSMPHVAFEGNERW